MSILENGKLLPESETRRIMAEDAAVAEANVGTSPQLPTTSNLTDAQWSNFKLAVKNAGIEVRK